YTCTVKYLMTGVIPGRRSPGSTMLPLLTISVLSLLAVRPCGILACHSRPVVWTLRGLTTATTVETRLSPTSTTATHTMPCHGRPIFARPLTDPTTCALNPSTFASTTVMISCG